ncbi:hypothetical protein [Actinomadura fibrosa]|uniref:hypothetical protein n=1 Tax=Actinomadura fibrosa TaxID=111802 RepID=UPI00366FC90B
MTCDRVRPALDRTDYTADRARLIVLRGLCTCRAGATDRPVRAPRHAAARKHAVVATDT